MPSFDMISVFANNQMFIIAKHSLTRLSKKESMRHYLSMSRYIYASSCASELTSLILHADYGKLRYLQDSRTSNIVPNQLNPYESYELGSY